MLSLGLDVSTKTGAVLLDGPEPIVAEEWTAPKGVVGLERCSAIAANLVKLLQVQSPDVICIENYGFANAHTLVPLVEIGTILRYFLKQRGFAFQLVAPNALKKFATGSGASGVKKDQVRLGVYKHWGFEHQSDNVVDAFVLAKIGQATMGHLVLNTAQSEVVAKLGCK